MTSTKHNGEVEFRFFRAGASEVLLAADFTGWLEQAVPMQPEGNGWWVARVQLDAGEYRFRYVADGEWFTDYASHGVEFKKKQWNSVLLVNEPAARRARAIAA
ncbi:MAG: glycogen-binding domain-containing protein [Phycisphaerae bacterium]|nr:glycogen-binding domain-containing protein [Tepidisphaeraceae bacterium]